jgi:uncharacterized protein YpmS
MKILKIWFIVWISLDYLGIISISVRNLPYVSSQSVNLDRQERHQISGFETSNGHKWSEQIISNPRDLKHQHLAGAFFLHQFQIMFFSRNVGIS